MITVYSKPLCPYCDAAENYLKNNDLEYRKIDISADADALRFIKEEKGHRSVPQIYYNDQLLVEGGFDGLKKLNAEEIKQRIETINVNK